MLDAITDVIDYGKCGLANDNNDINIQPINILCRSYL